MRTLVCLPTRNEKESVQEMIDKVRALRLDLIVVDEHSQDGTLDIVKRNNVSAYQRDGSGKGWGVRKALEVAAKLNYDFIVLIDCDCSYPVEAIADLLKFAQEFDMVVGSRDMRAIQFSHRLVNLFHTFCVNLLFGSRLSDINSGLRALRVNKFNGLLDAAGFDIEAEITVRALKGKFKIRELPVRYHKRVGKSKIRYWDTFRIFKKIAAERFCSRKH